MVIYDDEWLPQAVLDPSAQSHWDERLLDHDSTSLDLLPWSMYNSHVNANRGFLAEFIVTRAIGAQFQDTCYLG